MSYYVYILTNEFKSVLYVGITDNLARRLAEHAGEEIEGFTKKYHVHKLIYCEEYPEATQAILREKQLKGWSRSKKIALISSMNPKWKDLSEE